VNKDLVYELKIYEEFTGELNFSSQASILTALFDFMAVVLNLRPLVEDGSRTRGLLEVVNEAIFMYEELSKGFDEFTESRVYAEGLVELLTLVFVTFLLTTQKTFASASVPNKRQGPRGYAKKIFAIKKRSKNMSSEQIQFFQDRLLHVCALCFLYFSLKNWTIPL
jgi:hypothetical protein